MEDYATYLPPLVLTHQEGHTPPKQKPTIFWIGCCDAKVSEAEVLPEKEIFVQRNIANQFQAIDANALASLAYAVSLSTIDEIMIVGHTDCGGVQACYDVAQGKARPPLHWSLWNWLHGLTILAKAHTKLTPYQLTQLNVIQQVNNVRAVLGTLTNRPLKVGGYLYDIVEKKLVVVE
ncbi:hypothetical protein GALMADRAFT_138031 [Galerina marginata CBS 339.88]|uniref:Carbonic anhydrase n=1 Tax=Galerina marginata (strain CBS 339.88) TaxID=685588 RepID=A0A067T685_GALM3|nr:hypothetical protein GALMADRAFT_138031 [Galerina marginata CBS 339.88]